MRVLKMTAASAVVGAAMLLAPTAPVSAMPLSPAAGGAVSAALHEASPLIEVQRRGRGGYRRGGGGAGIAAGIAAGALLGGIIASQAAPPPAYYYGPPPRAYYGPPPGDPAIEYCMQRFRSYDPVSMTYLGYDGLRHPCP